MPKYLENIALDDIKARYRKYNVFNFLKVSEGCDNKAKALILKNKNGEILYKGTIGEYLQRELLESNLKTREIYGFENYHDFKKPMIIIMNQE